MSATTTTPETNTTPASTTGHLSDVDLQLLKSALHSIDGPTAIHLSNERKRLLSLPEEQRPEPGTPLYTAYYFAFAALDEYTRKCTDRNRANSAFSTGPRTVEGLLASSLNRQTHGLTGRSALLRTEDVDTYNTFCHDIAEAYAPIGKREELLVRKIADTEWRLERVPTEEYAIYAQGRINHTHLFVNYDLPLQPDLVDLHTTRTAARDLRNLRLHELRLNRQLEKLKTELDKLQRERHQTETTQPVAAAPPQPPQPEQEPVKTAAAPQQTTPTPTKPSDKSESGFVFTPHPIASSKPDSSAAHLTEGLLNSLQYDDCE